MGEEVFLPLGHPEDGAAHEAAGLPREAEVAGRLFRQSEGNTNSGLGLRPLGEVGIVKVLLQLKSSKSR